IGLKASTLTYMATPSGARRLMRTTGVLPTVPRMLSWIIACPPGVLSERASYACRGPRGWRGPRRPAASGAADDGRVGGKAGGAELVPAVHDVAEQQGSAVDVVDGGVGFLTVPVEAGGLDGAAQDGLAEGHAAQAHGVEG